MRSSYEENDYGQVFYNLIKIHKPEKVVELGVLDGYSSLHFAKGLKDNKKGHLYCYDLWEDYKYTHGDFESVYKTFNAEGVSSLITMFKGDAYEVYKEWAKNEIDILHVDISNDGKVLRRILELWSDKVSKIIAFEGGSKERDKIEWMLKYDKEPITTELLENEIIKEQFDVVNFLSFPSMILLFKKKYREEILG